MPNHYLVRTYRLPQGEEDLFSGQVWSQGILGVELNPMAENQLEAVVYYPSSSPQGDPFATPEWRARGVTLVSQELLQSQDWVAEYRRLAQPFALGRGFWVDPRDPRGPTPAADSQRRLLRLPARRAFGVGSHPSTRLVVSFLEELPIRDCRVLDVGTGSGILAFVALALGACQVVAVDLDLEAVLVARRNAELNGVSPHLFAGSLAVLRDEPVFDLAVVNIVPEKILPEVPALLRRLRPQATLVLSGLLDERREAVKRSLAESGLVCQLQRRDEEWSALVAKRGPGPPRQP